ncbi:MAG: metallophosphoesterase [Acidobacteriota bacterium]
MADFSMFLFIATFLAVYGGANYYLSVRSWQALSSWLPGFRRWIFLICFWILASSFVVGQLVFHYLPYGFASFFAIVGNYWLAILFYGVLISLFVDLVRLMDRFNILPVRFPNTKMISLAVTGLLIVIIAIGIWNAHHPVITHYNLNVDKKARDLKKLHVVVVSDMHSGVVMDNSRLAELVKNINAQKPDLVLFPGDIVDENMDVFLNENMGATIKQIRTRYGVYACLGNHEYYSGKIPFLKRYLADNNVILLQDQTVEIADSLYIIGRDEYAENPYDRTAATSIHDLLKGTDFKKPVIVMDHQPARIAEASEQNVDLLLCGHTHNGQIWPIKYLTHSLFIDDYGPYSKGRFQAIVSGGYGTWGPPLRVGNRPEIVDISISFH